MMNAFYFLIFSKKCKKPFEEQTIMLGRDNNVDYLPFSVLWWCHKGRSDVERRRTSECLELEYLETTPSWAFDQSIVITRLILQVQANINK